VNTKTPLLLQRRLCFGWRHRRRDVVAVVVVVVVVATG
jgi:hypothetical protein